MSACCEKRQCLKTQTKPPEHNNWPCSTSSPAPRLSLLQEPALLPGQGRGPACPQNPGACAPRVRPGWNTMFKTMLWDPAGASALVQRQPDGNEVERAALRWGMGNPFPFQGGENNSDSEIHIHMYLQRARRQPARASEMSLVLCVGLREQGREESLCHCPRAGGHCRARARSALCPEFQQPCWVGVCSWTCPVLSCFSKSPRCMHSKIANIERYKHLFGNFHFSMCHAAGKQ